MKKLLVLFIAVLLMAGPAFGLEDGRRTGPGAGDIMGQGVQQTEPFRSFRLVRVVPGLHQSGSISEYSATNGGPYIYSVSRGMVMIWWTGTSGGDARTVAPCARVSYDSRVAGVLATNCDISSDQFISLQYVTDDTNQSNWSWLQTYGYHDGVLIGAAVSVGDMLGTCFAVTGGCAPYNPSNAASTTAKSSTGGNDPARSGSFGFAYQADAGFSAGDKVAAFINAGN